ncbi:MAG: outer membrane lipoprotein-sorting protein, partial [Bacteroidales bacterium]|nr:outer membrane lipoprotein-sorting protein [Bacteroidales bacterium]
TFLKKMDDLMNAPNDRKATVQIILTKKNDKEKVREAEMFQKGKDKRLYRYTKPESQAGIATLSLPGDVMWLYLPAFGKPTKISMLAKSQAFTGTDFSMEDMDPKPYSERFVPKLLETKEDVYVLELTPDYEKSDYSKLIVMLDKEHFYPHQIDYYDKRDEKVKEATYQYTKSGKYWYAREVTMTDLKKDHSTQIVILEVQFDVGLTDEVFTVENLKPTAESGSDQ